MVGGEQHVAAKDKKNSQSVKCSTLFKKRTQRASVREQGLPSVGALFPAFHSHRSPSFLPVITKKKIKEIKYIKKIFSKKLRVENFLLVSLGPRGDELACLLAVGANVLCGRELNTG